MSDPYIRCQVCNRAIFSDMDRIQPIGGVIHCGLCWNHCMKNNHDFCNKKKGAIDFSTLNLDDPSIAKMYFKKE